MAINATNPFKGRQYSGEVILTAVRWYLRYPLAYEHVSELLAELRTRRGCQPRCTATGIEIKKAINSSRKIVLRRVEMMQVVSNLIMNSIYAMHAGGVLSISVEDAVGSSDGIVLTIRDDGGGIAEATLPRVFEAFFTTRSTVGTGNGLFVSKQFVEGHGGQIEIESRQNREDHGTTVRVFLPISTTYDSSGEGVRAMD